MGAADIFKVSRKTFINPRAWLGYDSVKEQTTSIVDIIKAGATPRKPERSETFTQALHRLDLKEQAADEIGQTYFVYSIIFLALGIADFIYGFYLLFNHGSLPALILSFSVLALLLVQAFKYNFWSFQIKKKKLGCTVQEWTQGYVKLEKNS